MMIPEVCTLFSLLHVENCEGAETICKLTGQLTSVLWMLTEAMKPLGQRQRTIYDSQKQQQPEHQHFLELVFQSQFSHSGTKGADDACTPRFALQESNSGLRETESFVLDCEHVCPLLQRQILCLLRLFIIQTGILEKIVLNGGNLLCASAHKLCRNIRDWLPILLFCKLFREQDHVYSSL